MRLARAHAFLALLLAAAPVIAQKPAAPTGGAIVEAEPIRCWLKTTQTAVHIGERFNLALTCAVVETSHVSVVPDVSQIEPTTIQLQPFEVLSGTHPPDIRSRLWRYFQYEYTLRLIADGYFGQDVAIPAVTIRYTVHTSGGGSEQQGIERSYILPTVPVRIISLVPQSAKDIRDASRSTFADIDRRRFRGTVALTAAAVLFAFAGLLAAIALAHFVAHFRRHKMAETPTASAGLALSGASRVLREVSDGVAEQGWNQERIAQTLAALRIGAAVAARRPLAQTQVAPDVPVREGQLAVRQGILRSHRFLLSSAVTPASLAELNASEELHALREALTAFSEARYAQDEQFDSGALNHLLENARDVLGTLKWRTRWPLSWMSAIAAVAASKRSFAWTR